MSELYSGGPFIQIDALQELVRAKTGEEAHTVTVTTHIALQHSLKYVINSRETFDNTKVIFPNTIPLLNPIHLNSNPVFNIIEKKEVVLTGKYWTET